MLPKSALSESTGVVMEMEPVDWVMVPVPVAVKVTDDVPDTLLSRTMASLVPVPRSVRALPVTAPATLMEPASLLLVRVKLLTVEAPSETAVALSVTETVPVTVAVRVPAAVVTFNVAGAPSRFKETLLAELLTLAMPVVLAVRVLTPLVRLKVAALPAIVTAPVLLAALLTKAVPVVLAVMEPVELPVIM